MNRTCAASLIVSSGGGTAGAVLQPQLEQASIIVPLALMPAGQVRNEASSESPAANRDCRANAIIAQE
jgi:hypothetical protein